MITDYKTLKKEKAWITAEIRSKCPWALAETILSALDTQEREILKAQKEAEEYLYRLNQADAILSEVENEAHGNLGEQVTKARAILQA